MLTVILLVAIPIVVYPKMSYLALYKPSLGSGLQQHRQLTSIKNVTLEIGNNTFSKRQYGGFVLATSYYDQMTSATRRVFTLHGWAAKLNLTVVEPFIIRSKLGLNKYAALSFNTVRSSRSVPRFSDMLNINDWNRFIESQYGKGHMSLWDDFVKFAPRSIIYIVTQFPTTVDPSPNSTFLFQSCPNRISDLKYLSTYNFTVLKAWCIVLSPNIKVSMDKFTSSVLKDQSIHNVTLVFSLWKGNGFYPCNTTSMATYKIHGLNHKIMARMVSYSPAILKSVDEYVRRLVGSKRYVAVMVRTQRALIEKDSLGLTRNASESISFCIQRTITKWKGLSQKERINATFLAMDVGKFGSFRYSKQFLVKQGMYAPIKTFITTLLGNETTLESWEQSFVDVSPDLTPGIIAMVQKVLAAQSTCLILAGGGTYQQNTEALYISTHQKHDEHLCLEKVKRCAV